MLRQLYTSLLVLSCAAAFTLPWQADVSSLRSYQGCGPCTKIEPGFYPNWMDVHDRLAKELQEAEDAGGWDLVFFGDSITETWRGTEVGNKPCWNDRCKGVPEVFDKYFGSVYKSGVLAIGGDQAYHQLWRMQNGELPSHAKVAVLLIGTNDLGYSECDQGESAISAAAVGTALRVRDILEYLAEERPEMQVVLLGLLPRGEANAGHPFAWPSMFTAGIKTVNAMLTEFGKHNKRVHYVPCAKRFVLPDGGLREDLYAQAGIHPNVVGMEELAKCISPIIAKLMDPATAGNATNEA